MARSRALVGGIPRAFRSHKTPEGAAYRVYCQSMLARLGKLPTSAWPTLREAGRLTIELGAMGEELEAARARRRRRDVARLRRAMIPARTQLLNMERRLEELASRNGHSDPLAAVRKVVSEANGR